MQGQLGINDEEEEVTSPTQTVHSFAAKIRQVSNGCYHTLLLLGILIINANKTYSLK